jgi:hypothetical protein
LFHDDAITVVAGGIVCGEVVDQCIASDTRTLAMAPATGYAKVISPHVMWLDAFPGKTRSRFCLSGIERKSAGGSSMG